MKYIKDAWENAPDETKYKTISEELKLFTHIGTTKDDLLMMLKWIFQREQAAIKDIEYLAGHVTTGEKCNICRHNINDMGCELDDKDDDGECHFEWRGPSIA